MGGVPTIVKAWRAPETENPSVFALSGLNGAITLLTLQRWDPATRAFPVYIAAIGFGVSALIVVRPRSVGVPARPG